MVQRHSLRERARRLFQRGSDADILRRGVREWNAWRQSHPLVTPNLQAVDLRGADLREVDFNDAELAGADLGRADLRNANLRLADLPEACLIGADLREANLDGADLSKADLSRADLRQATLVALFAPEVNLTDANLQHANLREAHIAVGKLIRTNLSHTNLEGVLFCDEGKKTYADLSGANLTGAKFTPRGVLIHDGSFLDLAATVGLESATFSTPDFLQCYIAEAFEYLHDPNTPEATDVPALLTAAMDRISYLRSIHRAPEPPRELVTVVRTITRELIEFIRKHPDELHRIRPRQFEELVAEILAGFGWEVQLTPPVKDGGYDIFAISKDTKSGVRTSWIIECKKYATRNAVGVDIVRSLYGLKSFTSGVANAMLATTSHFSKDALKFKASRYDLDLRDYGAILEWIDMYAPRADGALHIRENKLLIPGKD